MSMLATLGGLAGGLGGSGGVGGSIPSNSSAASSAATVTSNPATAVSGIGGANFSLGPFNPVFPGASVTPTDSINSPGIFAGSFPQKLVFAALGVVAALAFFLRVSERLEDYGTRLRFQSSFQRQL